MAGTKPVGGNLSMDDLAATLTSEEQLGFEQLTVLAADSGNARNLATFVASTSAQGGLAICAAGGTAQGTKIMSGVTVFINGAQAKIDVYRLPS